MAGTVVIDTVKSSTTGPAAFQNTSGTEIGRLARAWVCFDGSTSPGTIRSAFNVSSITKNATGDYTVNFTNALTDANYSVVCSAGIASNVANNDRIGLSNFNAAPTSGACSVATMTGARALTDATYTSVSVFR